jgi:hypothetical protein
MRSMAHQTRLAIAVAVAVATALAGCGSHHDPGPAAARRQAGRSPTAQPPVVAPPSNPSSGPTSARKGEPDAESRAAASQVSAARPVARAFFISYVAHLYGRQPARGIAGADRSLQWELEHGHATITPAEHSSRPRLTHLAVAAAGPPVSVVATAVIDVGHHQLAHLSATLEPHRHTWRVVAIGP